MEGALAVAISEMEEAVATAAAETERGMDAKMATLATGMEILQSDIDGLASVFDAKMGNVSDLAGNLELLGASLSVLEAHKAEVGERVDHLESGLRSLESSAIAMFGKTDDSLADMNAALAGLSSRVEEGVEAVDSLLETRLEAEVAARKAAEDRVGVLEGVVEGLKGQIQGLAAQLGTLASTSSTALQEAISESQLQSALASLELRMANSSSGHSAALQTSLDRTAEALSSHLTRTLETVAGLEQKVDALSTRVQNNTHVSVANDIAFRQLKARMGGVVSSLSSNLVQDINLDDSAIADAAIDTFLSSVHP